MRKKKKPQSVVADKAEQAQEAVSEVASQIKATAQDTVQQAGDQAKQAAQVVADERGKVGLGFALILLLAAGVLYWRITSDS